MPATTATATTTARGYGWRHRQAVRRLRAGYQPGDPCRRCGRPMWPWQPLDAGHDDHAKAGTGALPTALEHRTCNRAASARNTNAKRRARSRHPHRTPTVTSRTW